MIPPRLELPARSPITNTVNNNDWDVKIMEINKVGQYLTFLLGSESYGLPIGSIREINRVGEITPVPKTPDYIKGIMNLRGKIIPVVGLRSKFNLEEQEYTRNTCIIVLDTPVGHVGMIVDAVQEVVDLAEDRIEAPPALGNSQMQQFIKGMGKTDSKVIILIDIQCVMSDQQLAKLNLKTGGLHAAA
jgi:purine-binding chemotaxis protein CheW